MARIAVLSLLFLQAIVGSATIMQVAIGSVPSGGFFAPANGGGSMLDDAGNGLGEPLNVSAGRIQDVPLFLLTLVRLWRSLFGATVRQLF